MTDPRYEKLDRMRADIQADREKLAKMHEQFKQREAKMLDQIHEKEAKLKEAENLVIVADVGEMKLSPEQLGAFLKLLQSGKIPNVLGDEPEKETGNFEETESYEKTEDEEDDFDEDEEKVKKYNVGNILPVIIVFDEEKEIKRIIGEKSKKELFDSIEELVK